MNYYDDHYLTLCDFSTQLTTTFPDTQLHIDWWALISWINYDYMPIESIASELMALR